MAMRVVPAESETMIELGAKEVELVPPLETGSVPEMLDSVDVAVHVGTPFDRARTNPSVVFAIDDRLLADVV